MRFLRELVYRTFDGDWREAAEKAFAELFDGGRYGKSGQPKVQARVRGKDDAKNPAFAALIPPDQPDSGAYGGMSFVLFPNSEGGPALISLVIGTHGLQPDEEILSRPGHGRKVAAIARWLNDEAGRQAAWAKRDPVQRLLEHRRFVVMEGPPGTGKTRLARKLLRRSPVRRRGHPGRRSWRLGADDLCRRAPSPTDSKPSNGRLMSAVLRA